MGYLLHQGSWDRIHIHGEPCDSYHIKCIQNFAESEIAPICFRVRQSYIKKYKDPVSTEKIYI